MSIKLIPSYCELIILLLLCQRTRDFIGISDGQIYINFPFIEIKLTYNSSGSSSSVEFESWDKIKSFPLVEVKLLTKILLLGFQKYSQSD